MHQTFKSELLSSTFPKKTKKHLLEKTKKTFVGIIDARNLIRETPI